MAKMLSGPGLTMKIFSLIAVTPRSLRRYSPLFFFLVEKERKRHKRWKMQHHRLIRLD